MPLFSPAGTRTQLTARRRWQRPQWRRNSVGADHFALLPSLENAWSCCWTRMQSASPVAMRSLVGIILPRFQSCGDYCAPSGGWPRNHMCGAGIRHRNFSSRSLVRASLTAHHRYEHLRSRDSRDPGDGVLRRWVSLIHRSLPVRALPHILHLSTVILPL